MPKVCRHHSWVVVCGLGRQLHLFLGEEITDCLQVPVSRSDAQKLALVKRGQGCGEMLDSHFSMLPSSPGARPELPGPGWPGLPAVAAEHGKCGSSAISEPGGNPHVISKLVCIQSQ